MIYRLIKKIAKNVLADIDGNRVTKSFSIKKYGDEEAKRLAIETLLITSNKI